MIDIGVRLIAAWLAHPNHGVNTLAQLIPRHQFGVLAVDAAPPIVDIYNDADHEAVAKNFDAPSFPALIVWGDSGADAPARGIPLAKDVVIAAGFFTRDDADDFTSNRQCGYILRAARRSLRRYNSQQTRLGYDALNGIEVVQITHVEEQRITAAEGRAKVWGFLAIHVQLIETLQ